MNKLFLVLLLTLNVLSAQASTSVESFVRGWFAQFDQFAAEAEFLSKIVDEDLEMSFPEASLNSHEDFVVWYAGIKANLVSASHLIKEMKVLNETSSNVLVKVRVLWQAESISGEKLKFNALQTWTLNKVGESYKIQKYLVQEDLAALSPSRLSCTCYGGPGNYAYQCAPIEKTCHGGPGNYAYSCNVCP